MLLKGLYRFIVEDTCSHSSARQEKDKENSDVAVSFHDIIFKCLETRGV